VLLRTLPRSPKCRGVAKMEQTGWRGSQASDVVDGHTMSVS
jgi:hypothetical protein